MRTGLIRFRIIAKICSDCPPVLKTAHITDLCHVDNYEEAIKLLEGHGFKSYQNIGAVETGSSTVTIMKSPSGFSINVSEHKK